MFRITGEFDEISVPP